MTMETEPPAIPKSLHPDDLGFTPAPMSGWFHPTHLLRLALQVIVSIIFGRYSDNREMQAALGQQKHFSYKKCDEIWFDYVGDLGDGWNSTYTIAKLLAEETLAVTDADNNTYPTQRGRFLIMGGDQVYPSASRANYLNRTEGPYRAALPWVKGDSPPDLYAIPGNHDWYDGLTSFTRLFCQKRWIGGWKTQQSRSYFAVELPHNWWLFAFDIQLGADIDKPQLDYFEAAINQLSEKNRVIFATAKCAWLEPQVDARDPHENITYLEKRIVHQKAQVYLNVAGDIHNYAHYQNDAGTRHKITAGGGGAFLHYTHSLPSQVTVNEAAGTQEYKVTPERLFPTPKASKKLTWGALGFMFKNWHLAIFFGCYLLLTLWVVQSASIGQGNSLLMQLGQEYGQWRQVLHSVGDVLAHSPASCVFLILFMAGLVGFCEPPTHGSNLVQNAKRIFGGLFHGVAQLTGFLVLISSLVSLNQFLAMRYWHGFESPLVLVCEILFLGSALAGTIMGIYLFIAHRIFYFHSEAAASCNRIEDYKNFLRFHLDKNGQLNVYAMGISKVEKDWVLNKNGQDGDCWLVPTSGKPMHQYVQLIELPFKV